MRPLRAIAHAHVHAIVFACALAAGVVVHFGPLPIAHETVRAFVNGVLYPIFAGRITIDRIGFLGLTRASGIDAHVDDPEGRTVLRVKNVEAEVSTIALVHSLFKTTEPLVIGIPDLSIAETDAQLDHDETGDLRIARAFALRSPSKEGSPPGRGVLIVLPHIHFVHVVAHAEPSAPYDADANDVDASLSFSQEGISIDILHAALVARGPLANAEARGTGTAHIEKLSQRALTLRGSWGGTVGGIPETANATLDGEKVDATVDAGPAGADEVRTIIASWPLAGPARLHAEAHGTLPRLAVSAHVEALGGQIDASGPVTIGPTLESQIHLKVTALSGRTLASPLPFDLAGAAGDFTIAVGERGAAAVQASFTLDESTWDKTRIPPAAVRAEFTGAASGSQSLRADVALKEPGLPTTVSLQLDANNGVKRLSFVGDARTDRLESIPRFRGIASGGAEVHATGTMDLTNDNLDAEARAIASDLRVGETTVRSARVDVRLGGKLRAPQGNLALQGEELDAGPVRLSAFQATSGFSVGSAPALRDVEMEVAGDGQPARAHASLVEWRNGGLDAEGVAITGLGEPLEGSARLSEAAIAVQALSRGINLGRVASFVSLPVREGTLGLMLDATVQSGQARGRVVLDLQKARVAGIANAAARLEARIRGRQVGGMVIANAGDLGTLDARSSALEVGQGDLMTAGPWTRAWGAIDVKAHADLAALYAQFASSETAKSHRSIAGKVDVGIRLERDSPTDVTPELELTARTVGLSVSIPHGASDWRIDGIDPAIRAVVNGTSGATTVSIDAHDKSGQLLTLEGTSAAVPYAKLFSADAGAGMIDALRAMPFAAHVEVPTHALASLPSALGTAGMRGALSAKVDWQGTVEKPDVVVAATLTRGPSDRKLSALPLDFALSAEYNGADLEAALDGSWHGSPMLRASGHATAKAADVLSGLGGADVPWTASAQARLDKLPLRSLSVLDDRQIQGTVTGKITLSDLHKDARVSADLRFDELQVGDAVCRAARATLSVDGHVFDGGLQIDDANGGHLRTRAHFGMHWGQLLVPALDIAEPATAEITATAFQAALLLPFVSGTFTELDGTLDSDAHVSIDPASETAKPEGTIRLRDAAFELTSLGGAFHGVGGTLAFSPDGVIRLEDAVAHGTSGEIQASATGRLKGFALDSARGTVIMPRTAPLPLIFEGVQIGMLDGRFDLDLNRSTSGTDIALQVPSLHLELPAGSATRDVQTLGGMEGVDIGLVRDGSFTDLSLDATYATPEPEQASKLPIKIAVHLGNDVQVIRSTDLDVHLEGQPIVTLASTVSVAGQIRLASGSIDVKGKGFTIEHGTVTFLGADETNPQVVLTAGWAAPDGTRIYADFVGPLKTGKVTLRAEPSRPQNEILALLLFGTSDDSSNGNQGYTAGAQAGGAVATQPINQALGGLNRSLDKLGLQGGISAKVDTSTPNPRPEVEIQIARDISLQIGWVLGVPPISNPDTTLVTLDWNFIKKWSLETTVGDQGSSIVDVVWQHRY